MGPQLTSSESALQITALLQAWRHGDQGALATLIPILYSELHQLAHRYMVREREPGPLQTTALVNEVYLRLVDFRQVRWKDRSHFLAVCAQLMRRILVDFARSRQAVKRGGHAIGVPLREHFVASQGLPAVDLLDLDIALNELAAFDARKSHIVELRFFGGLGIEDTAEVLDISPETVMRDWKMAKVWLLRKLTQS